MISRVVVGAGGFSIHGEFDDDSLYFLMEGGDELSGHDMTKVENYVNSHRDGDIFIMPAKYKPTAGNKGGMMYAPYSKWTEVEGAYAPDKVDANAFAGLHKISPFGAVFRGKYLNLLMKETKSEGTFDQVLVRGSYQVLTWLLNVQCEACVSGKLYYIDEVTYLLCHSGLGDKTFFEGVYHREWYDTYIEYLKKNLKMLSYIRAEGPSLDERKARLMHQTAMEHAIFVVKFMIEANMDNVNKHLFEGIEAEKIMWRLGEVLTFVKDDIICGGKLESDGRATARGAKTFVPSPGAYHIKKKNEELLTWVLLIIKYRKPELQFDFADGYYSYRGNPVGMLTGPTADIQFMDNADVADSTELTVEGRLNPIMLMNGATFGAIVGNDFYPATYDERYAHTKAFGMSIYKLQAFSIKFPLIYGRGTNIQFVTRYVDANGRKQELPVTLEYDSHFSRLCNRFEHSYWKLNKHLYMYQIEPNEIAVRQVEAKSLILRELALWKDMLLTKQKKVIKFILVRAFLQAKPLLKHKPIWLFWDKIYKAGDSAEYLYRYALKQNDGVKCYYLADGKCDDYERLKAEGLKPIKRRSLMHRYAFLYADMVVVSNSTVYAFNDFGTINSALIRDLMNFHVACVQHGMSIQKIAIAQNRLRDNTRLYFCASKFEIENLSKPVYGYGGYDALKLTGVPRYDGLINEDKKQILITPTWRMQAAVPVTKNEGVSRDYNPLFKTTDYFKIYNSLINEPRLIAAANRCGYKIIYLLHPIVSPQIDDFDKNGTVEIIPSVATGNHKGANYEKLLRESSLMVTDFSGVQFDFAYMKKPILYLHHRDIPKHYEEGTFVYAKHGFGEICEDNEMLISHLIDYMEDGCKMKPEFRRRAEDFFAFDDRQNCRRVYDEMIAYQREKL